MITSFSHASMQPCHYYDIGSTEQLGLCYIGPKLVEYPFLPPAVVFMNKDSNASSLSNHPMTVSMPPLCMPSSHYTLMPCRLPGGRQTEFRSPSRAPAVAAASPRNQSSRILTLPLLKLMGLGVQVLEARRPMHKNARALAQGRGEGKESDASYHVVREDDGWSVAFPSRETSFGFLCVLI